MSSLPHRRYELPVKDSEAVDGLQGGASAAPATSSNVKRPLPEDKTSAGILHALGLGAVFLLPTCPWPNEM